MPERPEIEPVRLERAGGDFRHTTDRIAAADVGNARPDTGGQLVDKREEIPTPHAVGHEDAAGGQIFELRIDADLCASLEDAPHDKAPAPARRATCAV